MNFFPWAERLMGTFSPSLTYCYQAWSTSANRWRLACLVTSRGLGTVGGCTDRTGAVVERTFRHLGFGGIRRSTKRIPAVFQRPCPYYLDVMAGPTMQEFIDLKPVIGTIVRCESNTGARDPALSLWIDLGPDGVNQSSAKLTDLYEPQDLVGRQVVAITGFEPMRVGGFRSDVLVIGGLTDDGVVLLMPDRPVPPGTPVA